MTLEDIAKLVNDLNIKTVILIGKYAENDYRIVKVDTDGKLITTTS